MKVIAVVPVSGREPLLKYTISRLVNQVFKVICIGHTKSESEIIEAAGADFYSMHPHARLGAKWDSSVAIARDYSPDAILIMGSAGMISDNWCESLYPDLESYSMVGVSGIHYVHVNLDGKKKMLYWSGYTGGRSIEPIGVGRMVSKAFLDKCNWQIFDKNLRSSLDYSTIRRISQFKGTVHINKSPVCSVRISSDKWANKNSYSKMARVAGSAVKEVQTIYEFFPEIESMVL